MEYVKICGLKNSGDIETCVEMGADAIGFIYKVPESPRNLEKSEINKFTKLVEGKILTVGVIKPQNIIDLADMMKEINVDIFQIHFSFNINELINLPDAVKKRLIVVQKLTQANFEVITEKINENKHQFHAFLIDNSEGQGKTLDINLMDRLLSKTDDAKIILAGGIGIENIESIMKKLRIYGIDVSSSLESKRGVKDSEKIVKFLEKIKEIKNKL